MSARKDRCDGQVRVVVAFHRDDYTELHGQHQSADSGSVTPIAVLTEVASGAFTTDWGWGSITVALGGGDCG